MKQLKFNPKKDMKELEKYGFNYTYGEDWHRCFDSTFVSRGDNDEFVVSHDYEYLEDEDVEKDINQLLLLEYDLIKADLLIVEEVKK